MKTSELKPGKDLPAQATSRRGRPRLDPEVRRQRVITAASELFIQHGYADTTVEMVGKAAGVTKRTIYELIGDKAALFRVVCNRGHTGIRDVKLNYPCSSIDLRETLLDLAHALLDHALASKTIAIERAMVMEQVRFPDLMATLMGATRTALNDQIASVFLGLSAKAMLGPVDAFKTTEVFFDVVVGNHGFRKVLGFDEPPPTRDDIVVRVDMFINGFLHPKGLVLK